MTPKRNSKTEDKNEKTFHGYAILNWKEGDMKLRKTKPSDKNLSPYQVPVQLNFTLEVPEIEIPEISTTMEIEQAQVRQVVSEELELGTGDEEVMLDSFTVKYADSPQDLALSIKRRLQHEVVTPEAAEAELYSLKSEEIQYGNREGFLEVIDSAVEIAESSETPEELAQNAEDILHA